MVRLLDNQNSKRQRVGQPRHRSVRRNVEVAAGLCPGRRARECRFFPTAGAEPGRYSGSRVTPALRVPSSPCALALVILCALLVVPGCEKPSRPSKKDKSGDVPAASSTAPATLAARKLPAYRFADDALVTRFPDVAAFVRNFLETCLTGDYAAYRKLVSRNEEPQSREKFDRVYSGLSSIDVELIEVLPEEKVKALPMPAGISPTGPVYRVVSLVQFDPEANISLRYRSRKLAILAFEEDGQWRMRTAPSKMQPRDDKAADSQPADSQPSEAQPDYPWDLDGDR